jgi:hypothetical protein
MILDNFFEPRKKSIAEDLDQPTQLAPGLSQTTSSKTGLTTQKYSMGPANFKQTTDAKGKVLSRDLEIDHGTGKFALGQAGGITSKSFTPAPGQEGMSSRDLYSLGDANKAATYDRAIAAVNEAPRAPGSPALATPKAPRAPSAPRLEEDDQPLDMNLVKQLYRNNKDIIGPNMNVIEPKTVIDLPDGTPYEIQPGDTLSKIARKLPAIKAAAQSQMSQTVAPTDAIAAQPSWFDKVKQAASGIAAGQFPSQAIPAAFPSLKKPAPAAAVPAPVAATSGTVVQPDWSQTKYNNLGPLVKGSDGVWRTQDGQTSAADPEIIAMAELLARSKTAPAAKAAPEKVAPADSLNPGKKIVVKSKVKPGLPPRTPSPEPFMPPVAQPRFPHVPSPQPFMPAGANPERPKPPYVPTPRPTGKEPPPTATPTGIAAAAEKTGGAGKKIGQAYDWLANLVKGRESGGDYDIGYHYDPGTGKVGPDKRLSSAWGAYGFTKKSIRSARDNDPTLNKPIEQWTPADQDRAFNINNDTNIKRMKDLGIDFAKHPEAPSIAMFLGADGAAEYYKTGKFSKDTLDSNGGEKGVRKIIATRTKDALDALEMQKKQKEKQKTKESAVAETVQTVKVMLETATTRDDVRRIKDYIDRQYTRHGLTDPVSFAQRNHLVERVIEITGKRLLRT